MSETSSPDMPSPTSRARIGAEALGTFWLVLGGCGTAIVAGDRVGNLGIALAFGLTVLTGVYALGHVSGGHFNPAVTIGLATARRFGWKDVPLYIGGQVVGATIAGALLLAIAHGKAGFDATNNFALNGYGEHSPDGYGLWSVLIAEAVLTAMFLYVILGATARRATPALAGAAIGLALTLIHLVAIPISNTSVNPARSLGVAWYGGADALSQVWAFLVAPAVGALIAGATHALITGDKD